MNQVSPTETIAQSLIGKRIIADGWHYDNGGFASGLVTKVESQSGGLSYKVSVEPDHIGSMGSYTFRAAEMVTLVTRGELPEANKYLNTGTNAKIVA